jgi:hypothetical protein
MTKLKTLIGAGLMLAATASFGFTTTGDLQEISPPPTNADSNQLESNDYAFIWRERAEVTTSVSTFISVDPFVNNPSGFYDSGNAAVEANWNGYLAPGTYNSYMIHGDKDGPNQTFVGSVTFDEDILGVVYKQTELCDTDAAFGSPSTVYSLCGSGRIFELDGPNNWFSLSPDAKTLSFSMVVQHNMDEIRIITSVVPIPAALWLFGSGLGLLGWMRRKPA